MNVTDTGGALEPGTFQEPGTPASAASSSPAPRPRLLVRRIVEDACEAAVRGFFRKEVGKKPLVDAFVRFEGTP